MTGRVHDATGLGASASRALIESAVEGDCLLCNRPRWMEPSAGGCRCIAVDPTIQEADLAHRIRRAFTWRREIERERRERRRDALWRWAAIVLLALAFWLLAVL